VLHEHTDGTALVAPARLTARRAAIDPAHASRVRAPGAAGGTMHLNVVDPDGLTVSLTQSNCAGFGSHVVVPGLRVFLQNRGQGFSLEPGHPAEYGPGRRPPHTLCPAFVTKDRAARYSLGTMGGDSQPMVILQLLARMLHANHDPARAVAAGRWVLSAPNAAAFEVWNDVSAQRVRIEGHAPPRWEPALRALGHEVEVIEPFAAAAGYAHVIAIAEGMLAGAADPRALVGSTSGY
jgi:gamma-glutamyltranspeptidase/glutathione hydrolase